MKHLFVICFTIFCTSLSAQDGIWIGKLQRNDGNNIPFTFEWKVEHGKNVWYIKNATEKIRVDNITAIGDSLIIQMPVFESQFRVLYKDKKITGVWLKNGAVKTQTILFSAMQNTTRFVGNSSAKINVSGRWAATFAKNDPGELSVAELNQTGNKLSGTFLNASGDYRFLEGIVTNDSMYLSCFDGGHAYLFTAKIENDKKISGGKFFSGAIYNEDWVAIKDNNAKISVASVAMNVKPGNEKLHFTFKDLNGKSVSIDDAKFKNKVVVIQLMGSWCPNCMDETAFLSDYYNKNKKRSIEIIALAYEYTTNWDRSIKSLKKFQQNFNVQYTILNTEVAVGDSLKTEKTLPEVTPIKTFPSSIILDKHGKIRKLESDFNGPATGNHYLIYKKEFEETINKLLKEN